MSKTKNSSSNPSGDPHRFAGKMGVNEGKVQLTGVKNPMNWNSPKRGGQAQPGNDLRPETRGRSK